MKKHEKTILVLPFSHTLSHLSRPLVLSKVLKQNGHKIVYGASSSRTGFIENEGFDVLPVFEPDPEALFSNIRNKKLKFVSSEIIEEMVEADIELINKVRPDLILSDGRFSAPISSQISGVKHVGIVNASSTEFRSIPYLPVDDSTIYHLLKKLCSENFINSCVLKFEQAVFDNTMNVFKRLSKKNGLMKEVTATNCLEGVDLTLIADVPEYFPTKNLPDNYHYIGPLTWKPSNMPLPEWWPPAGKDKKLIYISMGTTGLSDFFSLVHCLFENLDYTVVMTTGAQSDVKTIPGKIYVEPFIDGDVVMDMADLVICHGGNGTIYQALSHGKPVIGIPTIPDQGYNMRMVERLELGTTITWNSFYDNPEVLLAEVEKILNNEAVLKNALSFRSVLDSYVKPSTAVDLIESTLLY